MIEEQISKARIIPVIAIERVEDALPLCEALREGGLNVVEITFRTEAAAAAMSKISETFPDMLLGAGTVTQAEQVIAAFEAGARFAVAPGLNPAVVEHAREVGLAFFPGVCTPSDIETALGLGCRLMKFFPAGAFGGLPTIKAVSAPYGHLGVRFIPTGGVSMDNLREYLAFSKIAAVGGTWIAKSDAIAARDWDGIRQRAADAVAVAAQSD